MRKTSYFLALFIGVSLLSGCASPPVQQLKSMFQSKGRPQLETGIKLYEDARYPQAMTSFQNALNAGLGEFEQVTANKYLAFMSCVSGRDGQCRGYFRRALELDPTFELETAEAGHPTWGPVFRSVKAGR